MDIQEVSGKNISILIPQKPPFVMVGKVIASDEASTETSFFIEEDNIFVKDGFLREPGLIENIAQTLAVRGGIMHILEKKEVPLGMIGSIKNLHIFKLPAVGSAINTRIVIENEILMATLIRGQVTQGGELLAECEMKIFVKND